MPRPPTAPPGCTDQHTEHALMSNGQPGLQSNQTECGKQTITNDASNHSPVQARVAGSRNQRRCAQTPHQPSGTQQPAANTHANIQADVLGSRGGSRCLTCAGVGEAGFRQLGHGALRGVKLTAKSQQQPRIERRCDAAGVCSTGIARRERQRQTDLDVLVSSLTNTTAHCRGARWLPGCTDRNRESCEVRFNHSSQLSNSRSHSCADSPATGWSARTASVCTRATQRTARETIRSSQEKPGHGQNEMKKGECRT